MSSTLGYRTEDFTVPTPVSSFVVLHALLCVSLVTAEAGFWAHVLISEEADRGEWSESIQELLSTHSKRSLQLEVFLACVFMAM